MHLTLKNIDPNCAIEGLYIDLQTESLLARKHQTPLCKSTQFSFKTPLRLQNMDRVRIKQRQRTFVRSNNLLSEAAIMSNSSMSVETNLCTPSECNTSFFKDSIFSSERE